MGAGKQGVRHLSGKEKQREDVEGERGRKREKLSPVGTEAGIGPCYVNLKLCTYF